MLGSSFFFVVWLLLLLANRFIFLHIKWCALYKKGVHSDHPSCLLECRFYLIINLSFQWSFILHTAHIHFQLLTSKLFVIHWWIWTDHFTWICIRFKIGKKEKNRTKINSFMHCVSVSNLLTYEILFNFCKWMQLNGLTFIRFPHPSRKINLARIKWQIILFCRHSVISFLVFSSRNSYFHRINEHYFLLSDDFNDLSHLRLNKPILYIDHDPSSSNSIKILLI